MKFSVMHLIKHELYIYIYIFYIKRCSTGVLSYLKIWGLYVRTVFYTKLFCICFMYADKICQVMNDVFILCGLLFFFSLHPISYYMYVLSLRTWYLDIKKNNNVWYYVNSWNPSSHKRRPDSLTPVEWISHLFCENPLWSP